MSPRALVITGVSAKLASWQGTRVKGQVFRLGETWDYFQIGIVSQTALPAGKVKPKVLVATRHFSRMLRSAAPKLSS